MAIRINYRGHISPKLPPPNRSKLSFSSFRVHPYSPLLPHHLHHQAALAGLIIKIHIDDLLPGAEG